MSPPIRVHPVRVYSGLFPVKSNLTTLSYPIPFVSLIAIIFSSPSAQFHLRQLVFHQIQVHPLSFSNNSNCILFRICTFLDNSFSNKIFSNPISNIVLSNLFLLVSILILSFPKSNQVISAQFLIPIASIDNFYHLLQSKSCQLFYSPIRIIEFILHLDLSRTHLTWSFPDQVVCFHHPSFLFLISSSSNNFDTIPQSNLPN